MSGDASADVAKMSPTAPCVRGEGLRVVYRKRTVLEVDDITLPQGKTYALLGASGAGKSTLLRVLGMLERPTAGTVSFDGVPIQKSTLEARRRISAVFQKPYLLRGTVGYNVGYGLRLRHVSAAERKERIAEALARVGFAGWEDRSALTLSGGEAQRVALARALVVRPHLLLLDEPLSYMDAMLKRQLSLEFAEILASEHVTALYVTHDQDEAAVVADRIGVMKDGRIIAEGDPESVLTLPPDAWTASFLGTETPVRGVVASTEEGVAAIACDGATIYGMTDLPAGSAVELGVRPENVVVFEAGTEVPRSSARNQLDATVIKVSPSGSTVRVIVAAGGTTLSALLSRTSANALSIEVGTRVRLVFKATAVRVRTVPPPPHPD